MHSNNKLHFDSIFIPVNFWSYSQYPTNQEEDENLKYYFKFHVCLSICPSVCHSVRHSARPKELLYFRVSVTLVWSGPYAPPEELDSTRVAGTF